MNTLLGGEPGNPGFGALLRHWRTNRRMTQLDLANEAGISARHLSFLETGRSQPSREMVQLLAGMLNVPLADRNTLLVRAGYAPVYGARPLDSSEFDHVRRALDFTLRQQEPFPAVVMNRHWDILQMNAAGGRFFGMLLGDRAGRPAPNVLRLMFDPKELRPHVLNWNTVAEKLLQRLHREATGGVKDATTLALLAEILDYPDVPAQLRRPNMAVPLVPVASICFRHERTVYDFFSTVTTLGTPQDVTLEELRIECFFPANPATEQQARALLGG